MGPFLSPKAILKDMAHNHSPTKTHDRELLTLRINAEQDVIKFIVTTNKKKDLTYQPRSKFLQSLALNRRENMQ